MFYASGTGIVRFPDDGIVITPTTLKDQGEEMLHSSSESNPKIPVLGLYQTKSTAHGGRLVTYGDSNWTIAALLVSPAFIMVDKVAMSG